MFKAIVRMVKRMRVEVSVKEVKLLSGVSQTAAELFAQGHNHLWSQKGENRQ